MPDPRDSSVYQVVFKIVQLLARHPDEVVVKTLWTNEGASFTVCVNPEDRDAIFERTNHIEESLQHFLREVGIRLDRRFALTLEEAGEPGNGMEASAAPEGREVAAMAGSS